ncbi:MAG: nuclease A inhibitor family protein [Cyanobacteria bacterium J06648_11]
MSDLRDRLQTATDGLLWPSETDAPLEVFEWEREDAIAPETLLQTLEFPAETPIECLSIEHFFKKVTRDRDWHDDTEKARVRRFKALARLLTETLDNPQGFRVGKIDIDAFAIGKTPAGNWAGIRTHLVET